jgi:hypothetical protein
MSSALDQKRRCYSSREMDIIYMSVPSLYRPQHPVQYNVIKVASVEVIDMQVWQNAEKFREASHP